ncbi:hypothetical protein V6N12_036523 [Hibiscus sabdariffa]|uniref:Squalene monooxygenase n=1 Tax=Hibiscus sabdariffa TaxID=183260 RepID=A0ABR2EQU7_9ROSI
MPGRYLKLTEFGLEDCVDEIDAPRMLQLFTSIPSSSVSLEQGTVTSLLEENGTVKGVHYKDTNGRVLMAYAPLTIVLAMALYSVGIESVVLRVRFKGNGIEGISSRESKEGPLSLD